MALVGEKMAERMASREEGGRGGEAADANRLCLACARDCKQDARVTVVSCPKAVPARGR